jgi:membrane dipeptidase
MVDISHVADKTFYDALEISKAPLMASHSSCRAISDHPRNMGDDMIRALAKKGGVIQINYEITFLSQEARDTKAGWGKRVEVTDQELRNLCGENTACEIREGERRDREAMEKGELPQVSWQKIIEHIDHVVKLVGPDHVGLGSDFDGASMPLGMDDASKLPRLTEALLAKGYREEDVEKILGGNLLRVMEATERVKAELIR